MRRELPVARSATLGLNETPDVYSLPRENIKQIVKLLASVRALDHAISVASDHNVKEVKSLIEGK